MSEISGNMTTHRLQFSSVKINEKLHDKLHQNVLTKSAENNAENNENFDSLDLNSHLWVSRPLLYTYSSSYQVYGDWSRVLSIVLSNI
jgi:hypothetical protein